MTSDEAVLIQCGREPGDPCVITVNCLVKDGLACDICHTILEYGLCINKGDISTDGKWCYIVMWVVAQPSSLTVNWSNLKERLLCICPPCSVTFHYYQPTACAASSSVYLLKFFCLDRKGFLHDVTQVLCELELTIQRVKVTTTPDGRVLDLFFITDYKELLHTRSRHDETCERLHTVLGESCISCELQLAGPEYDARQGLSSSLSPSIIENLFVPELSDKDSCYQTLGPDLNKLKKASITMDNSLSPAHTLLQICCVDQKGLLYDILRTLKDAGIQIVYGRVSKKSKGYRDIDLFIQQQDGKKIVDSMKQSTLCSRLKMEMLHPLRVMIASRGPDTELWVANPVEMSGKGRPRVFYDVTYVLKLLSICIFSAEIGRYSSDNREWEVYRFLLDDRRDYDLSDKATRNQIVQSVIRTLMGW